GCDQVCAYCIVPRVRGRERSVPADYLVQQVNRLFDEGCKEVVLTGTQLGSYGFDLPDINLSGMLRRLLDETSVPRIRVSSLQPAEITDDLLSLWTVEGRGRLCPHFHVPLQSGSDAVLRRMRRRYTSTEFLDAVERVRETVPGVSVTSDVIAGFPGESPDDHADTLEIVARARFSGAHVFPYSQRPGTSAAHFGGHVPPGTRAERAAEIRKLADADAIRFRHASVGEVRSVLWESGEPPTGLTDNYLKVKLASGSDEAGTLENRIEHVRLSGVDGEVLTAERAQ
ncbi:MAG: MiaB/RimO family radical SAM methylthiotransferase, partial [Chloroflexota bacterium]